jgi:hypothetical protein
MGKLSGDHSERLHNLQKPESPDGWRLPRRPGTHLSSSRLKRLEAHSYNRAEKTLIRKYD